MKHMAWLLAVAFLWACSGGVGQRVSAETGGPAGAASGVDVHEGSNMKIAKTDSHEVKTFVRGPSVVPTGQLIAWLDQQQTREKPRLVRLPVILSKAQGGFSKRGARIGAAADALKIDCYDAALGISLDDRAKHQCKDETTCAMWMEGYWHNMRDGSFTFDVVRVHATISNDELKAASFAEVEDE